MLFPHLFAHEAGPRASPPHEIRVRDRALGFLELARRADGVRAGIEPGERIAVPAHRDLETVVAIVAILRGGATLVPINPAATERELEHLIRDSTPDRLLISSVAARTQNGPDAHAAGGPLDGLRATVVEVDTAGASPADPGATLEDEVDTDAPALIVYTSGTTGPPKGAVLSRRAVAANLDMLAEAWAWTGHDTLVHSLPLHHVHGLVLGVLGPLRVGGGLHHLGDFDPAATAAALRAGATMHFGVPTMYHRLADAADADPEIADALAGARLLVSGSAGLPLPVHDCIHRLTGHTIVERYGLTETMITSAVPAGVADKAGTVGPALRGVSVRVVDESGTEVPHDGRTMGEILVTTPALFDGYLGDDAATTAAMRDGWFVTGDTATIDADGYLRIAGRTSVDIIKSGGYKIGAGEIEDVLLEHASVAEVAVRGCPDPDLGEIVVAWVVPAPGTAFDVDVLREHAAGLLARYKQPRAIHLVESLPRNAMGKVQKARLESPPPTRLGPG